MKGSNEGSPELARLIGELLGSHQSKLPIDEIHDFNQRVRDRWVADKARTVEPGLSVLDVGAGTCPYKRLFSHCTYRTHDFKKYEGVKLGGTQNYGAIDYASDITSIPVAADSFDAILCTEVFEHVTEPIRALEELARILKPGGRLFITAPLGSGLHQLPFHFYGGYTPQWYRHFAEKVGLTISEITSNGGFFRLLAQECARVSWTLPQHKHLHGTLAPVVACLFGELLPRFLFALEEKCFIDQFTVGYHVEMRKMERALDVESVRDRSSSAAGSSPSRITGIIFSKDRPLQLDAALRSLRARCRDADSAALRVLYSTSTSFQDSLYRRLAEKHRNVEFVRERNFRADLRRLLDGFDHVAFFVDDNVCVKDFTFAEVVESLDKTPDALGFSLRLGKNTTYCYSFDRRQSMPGFACLDQRCLKFDWTRGEFDFGYPLEVSSSVYRIQDIAPALEEAEFNNPNALETQLDLRKSSLAQRKPSLLCYAESVAFCMPLNKVQTVCQNRSGSVQSYSPLSLAQLFEEGCEIDIDAYLNFVPESAHQEVELKTRKVDPARPVVSIVIPCYNQADFLPEAVESVVNQSFDDWECLIVNDGSPDHTSQVARELISKYPQKRIRLIEKPNGGLADARNAGIREALGAYILPLDSDDLIKPTMVEKTLALLRQHPEMSIACVDQEQFGVANRVIHMPKFDLNVLRFGNQLNYCSLFRRRAWVDVGGYNTNMTWGYEDWDFWIGCAEKGHFSIRLPEPLFRYRTRHGSMLSSALKHDAELRSQIIVNHPDLYNEEFKKNARRLLDLIRESRRQDRSGAGESLGSALSRLNRKATANPGG